MVRRSSQTPTPPERAPHPRGDGPSSALVFCHGVRCSPPAWGWSVHLRPRGQRHRVLPTRVGMVRRRQPRPAGDRRAPHPRGDGPAIYLPLHPVEPCSPPAWGWSERNRVAMCQECVLPTRVGMVRDRGAFESEGDCAPHPRGDGPPPGHRQSQSAACSPPAWGWSGNGHLLPFPRWVLPTRVGMVRATPSSNSTWACAPHPRGDGPLYLSGMA